MATVTMDGLFEEMFAEFEARAQKEMARESDLGVRLYVLAAQLKALYMQAEWVKDQCFPQTASGDSLDNHAYMRGLSRRGGVLAAGTVRFYAEEDAGAISIPRGTVLLGPELSRYETTADAVIPAGGSYADVPAVSEEGGSRFNAASGEVSGMALPVPGIRAVSNLAAFQGGADTESDEELRARVLETYKRLPNGANAVFYETEAMKIPGVESATAVGRARGRGTVDVYISTALGTPSAALLAEVYEALNEKREIAVDLQVKAPVLKPVALQLQIKPAPGVPFSDVLPQAQTLLYAYFTGGILSKPVYLAKLQSMALGLDGVENVRVTAPSSDVMTAAGELPVLSSLSITELVG